MCFRCGSDESSFQFCCCPFCIPLGFMGFQKRNESTVFTQQPTKSSQNL